MLRVLLTLAFLVGLLTGCSSPTAPLSTCSVDTVLIDTHTDRGEHIVITAHGHVAGCH